MSVAISEDFPKLFRRPDERPWTFSENFRGFSKISEDFRGRPEVEVQFKRLDSSEIIDIFTCEDITSSHVRISYRYYQFATIWYTTDFYIIKALLYCLENYRKTNLTTRNFFKYSTLYITDFSVVRVERRFY